MNNDIKLVIWDLDETFWTGTLSEEGIQIKDDNIELLHYLNNRGIMNSICSKNDFTATKQTLEYHNIWDLFIFPKIEFNSKGPMIKEIIENTQFRAENVLFIDDNHINLEEAKFFMPTINTITPDLLTQDFIQKFLVGKDDYKRTRLKQYKQLENKHRENQKYFSNEEFLYNSDIKVCIHYDCNNEIDRIFELIHRTNQLNFTKNRVSFQELVTSIERCEIEAGYIKVSDKYGDYDIVGFYALNKSKNVLEHFVFSCRILNLGVEQWVYANLYYPKINIIPEVATKLKINELPMWINQIDTTKNYEKTNQSLNDISCFIKGGCDLEQISYFLESINLKIKKEFNYVTGEGYPVHREHTEILKSINSINESQKQWLVESLPFYDANIFTTEIFEGYDVVIYSLLMNYTQGIYICKCEGMKNVKIAYGDFLLPLTDRENWEIVIKNSAGKISLEFLEWFTENFEFIGIQSEKGLLADLEWLRGNLPQKTKLVLLNGSEVCLEHLWEKERYLHHIKMNKVVDGFIADNLNKNVFLIDIRKHIKNRSDVTNNLRHYHRLGYKFIADDIIELFEKNYSLDRTSHTLSLINEEKLSLLFLKDMFNAKKYEEIIQEGVYKEDHIGLNFYKGKAFKILKDYESAIKCFQLYLNKLDDLTNLEKYKEIMTTIHISSVYFHLGDCYLQIGNEEKAINYLIECLRFSNYENKQAQELLRGTSYNFKMSEKANSNLEE